MKKKIGYSMPVASVTELCAVDVMTFSPNHISMTAVAEDVLIDAFGFGE